MGEPLAATRILRPMKPKRALAPFALALLALALALPAEARVRVHTTHTSSSSEIQIPPMPPLPEVDWKALLPTDILTVRAARAYLFAGPNTAAKPIGFLNHKAHVKRLAMEGRFFKVGLAGGKEAYVVSTLMLVGQGNIPLKNLGLLTVTAPSATLLMFPAAMAPKQGTLPKGSVVEKMNEATASGFIQVRLMDGTTSYVAKASLGAGPR